MKDVVQVNGQRVVITEHACERMAQRSVSKQAVKTVIEYGRKRYQDGIVLYFMGKKEVSFWLTRGYDFRCFRDLHVVIAQDDSLLTLLTVYKNSRFNKKRAPRYLRRKNIVCQAVFA